MFNVVLYIYLLSAKQTYTYITNLLMLTAVWVRLGFIVVRFVDKLLSSPHNGLAFYTVTLYTLHALIFTQLLYNQNICYRAIYLLAISCLYCWSQSLAPTCTLSPPIVIWTQDITQTTAVDNWNLFSNGKNDPVSSSRQQPGPTKGILKHFQPAQMKSVSLLF